MSWFAEPLFNSLLRLNRYGRFALSAEDTRNSNQFVALLLGGVALLGLGYATHEPFLTTGGLVALGLLFPLVGTQRQWQPQRRRQSRWFGWGLAAVGGLAVVLTALDAPTSGAFFTGFLVGTLLYIWTMALRR